MRLPARVALAALLAAAALGVTHLMSGPMGQAYFFLAFPAVAAAALLAGTGCGLLTGALTTGAFAWIFLEPTGSLKVAGSPAQVRAGGMLAATALVALLGGGLRRAYLKAEVARRRAEEAEREARRVSETQERILAVLGHDLRTPLSAIRITAEALRRERGLPGLPQGLARIASSADRMAAMIQDLLDLAVARQGLGLGLARERVQLQVLARHAVDELRQAHPGRRIELDAPQPAPVRGDPSRLHQVLTNLVANALQHGAADGPVRVALLADPGAAWVRVQVHNEGTPIPADALGTLFDPFRRAAPPGPRPAGAGLGLGLYVVREIVSGHGGAVSVRSSAEEGTTFEVLLPAGGGPALAVPAR